MVKTAAQRRTSSTGAMRICFSPEDTLPPRRVVVVVAVVLRIVVQWMRAE